MDEKELPRLRKYVFDFFLDTTHAPMLEDIMREFRLRRDEAHAGLKQLEASHHILLLPGTQRILMANPYSAIATPFRDTIGGKTYFANCAWDTVALHVMLDRPADVEASCHHCAEPIRLRLEQGKKTSSDPAEPLIFLSVPVSKWFENLINTCSNNMVYFSSGEHQSEWLQAHPGLAGETLTVEKMADACLPLSRGRMGLDYARPPPEKLMAYWESIGLRGDNWRI